MADMVIVKTIDGKSDVTLTSKQNEVYKEVSKEGAVVAEVVKKLAARRNVSANVIYTQISKLRKKNVIAPSGAPAPRKPASARPAAVKAALATVAACDRAIEEAQAALSAAALRKAQLQTAEAMKVAAAKLAG